MGEGALCRQYWDETDLGSISDAVAALAMLGEAAANRSTLNVLKQSKWPCCKKAQ